MVVAANGRVARMLLSSALVSWLAVPTLAQPAPFPKGFRTEEIATNGVTLHVRIGGAGPAVVLLHGYGETGDTPSPRSPASATGRAER